MSAAPEIATTPAAPRLELRSLVKSYGAVRAVRDVSLSIAPGRSTDSAATTAPASRR